MSDKLDHFVLEYDDESGLALLAMTEADGGRVADGAGLPYAVASGYEADSRTWESIESFDDVTRAKLRYELRLPHPRNRGECRFRHRPAREPYRRHHLQPRLGRHP